MRKAPLTCNVGELGRCRRQRSFAGHFDLVFDLFWRAALAAFLSGEGVLRGFLDVLALPVSPPGQEIAEDVADGLAACPGEAWSDEAGRGAGVVAGDADGHREGDAVRVDPGGPRSPSAAGRLP